MPLHHWYLPYFRQLNAELMSQIREVKFKGTEDMVYLVIQPSFSLSRRRPSRTLLLSLFLIPHFIFFMCFIFLLFFLPFSLYHFPISRCFTFSVIPVFLLPLFRSFCIFTSCSFPSFLVLIFPRLPCSSSFFYYFICSLALPAFPSASLYPLLPPLPPFSSPLPDTCGAQQNAVDP